MRWFTKYYHLTYTFLIYYSYLHGLLYKATLVFTAWLLRVTLSQLVTNLELGLKTIDLGIRGTLCMLPGLGDSSNAIGEPGIWLMPKKFQRLETKPNQTV